MRLFYLILIFQFCHCIPNGKKIRKHPKKFDRSNYNTIVETTNGQVAGLISETVDLHNTYVSFRGIPYAKPPVENWRFRPPEPAGNWTGILHAYRDGNPCTQEIPIRGKEDCLFINVYTPKLKNDDNLLPVLVWIYGGGFVGGDSSYDSFGPDYFLNENLIFISFNYRLGVFGFLSTEDLESPGNYGLKDQILALKWVQSNVRSFGGDPNTVTIFGESAGAASVAYLVQTPLTAGLFKRAISNSGNTLCQWALTRNPKNYAESIAKNLLIDTSNSNSIVNGLRKIPYDKLHAASYRTEIAGLLQDFLHGLIYSPTIEPEHEGAVLSGRSHQLLNDHHYHNVSYLMGFNSEEAAGWLETRVFFNIPISIIGAPLLWSFDANNSRLIPIDMNVHRSDLRTVGISIRNYYFNKLIPIFLSPDQFENFVTDDQFVRPVREVVRLYSRDVDVYYYRFSYIGDLGFAKGSKRYSTAGVSHAEDLRYLFRINTSRNEVSEDDYRTRYRLVRLWSNFVKYGNPTPKKSKLLQNVIWPVARNNENDTNLVYLDIGNNLRVRRNPNEANIRQWQDWYGEYGNPPYDTY